MEQSEVFTIENGEEVVYLNKSHANLFLEENASLEEFIMLEEVMINNTIVVFVSSAITTNSDVGSEKIDQDIEQNDEIIESSILENDAVELTAHTATRKTRNRKRKRIDETNPAKKKKNTPLKPPSHRKKSRNRRGCAKPDSWFRNMQHKQRIHGQEYESRNGRIIAEKTARYMENCPCIYKCHENFNEDAQKKNC